MDPKVDRNDQTEPSKRELGILDLGSNSFHMLCAHLNSNGSVRIIDKLKDSVRLASGLNSEKMLSPDIQDKALAALRKYGDRLRHLDSPSVRVVATDTFRKAKNGELFLQRAEEEVGFPIEIISGLEEARLIYKAVSYEHPSKKRRLVIDIGGGSTELIVGEGMSTLELRSLKMGCVSWTQRFFKDGQITRDRLKSAEMMALKELSSLQSRYLELSWELAQGTSGTIRSISNVLTHHGFDENITLEKLKWLSKELISWSKGKRSSISGLSDRRSEIIAGGISILSSIFRALELHSLQAVRPALREGVLLEMIGRLSGDDIRQQSIRRFAERLNVTTDLHLPHGPM